MKFYLAFRYALACEPVIFRYVFAFLITDISSIFPLVYGQDGIPLSVLFLGTLRSTASTRYMLCDKKAD